MSYVGWLLKRHTTRNWGYDAKTIIGNVERCIINLPLIRCYFKRVFQDIFVESCETA